MSNLTDRKAEKYFNYKSRNDGTKGPRLLGQIFLASGVIVILLSFINDLETENTKIALVAGGALVIGAILSTLNSGTLFDFQNRKFKEYQRFLWFESGEWEGLPEIDQVELVFHSFRTSFMPNGITPTINGQVTIYKCVLLSNGTKFLALDFEKEKAAVDALQKIKEGLGIL
ncbi:hypothetical protein PBT90_19270 [Algoriphagus halophytocola]|uniref:DUF304 domain-containing protein n=1 Tax=Algoriphagus halophytocola TaxID=2991499 RepID=A0ABY6MD46_9BACT|nr:MULTISPECIES: hypothetical protein [unclassified Algoriphagus]UZD21657.1 hypothetical protein OM944_13405 [Algoriphagus sp. TR-M5]WBL42869.1 hypothetical protein PBT90_19270 [Algoriphagus sp. TR-M9]